MSYVLVLALSDGISKFPMGKTWYGYECRQKMQYLSKTFKNYSHKSFYNIYQGTLTHNIPKSTCDSILPTTIRTRTLSCIYCAIAIPLDQPPSSSSKIHPSIRPQPQSKLSNGEGWFRGSCNIPQEQLPFLDERAWPFLLRTNYGNATPKLWVQCDAWESTCRYGAVMIVLDTTDRFCYLPLRQM